MPISSRRADQVIGIVELEGEPQHGRDRPERDVALVPIEPDADDLAALVGAAAHDAGIHHRGRVRSGFRAGQAEARDFAGVGETRQPVILLRLGAELMQQLARAERVRNHGGHGDRDRAGRELANDLRMRVGGKPEAAIGLRNDHRKELVRLEIGPDLGRQVAQLPGDGPIVEHPAQLLDRAVRGTPAPPPRAAPAAWTGACPSRDCRRTGRHPTRRRRPRSPPARSPKGWAAPCGPSGRSAGTASRGERRIRSWGYRCHGVHDQADHDQVHPYRRMMNKRLLINC